MSLLLSIIFLMTAALIIVPLTKRYTSNTVLGYLIAGLLLGSSGFALITDTQFITQITELGMLLLMFFLGLAFRPIQLWIQRYTILKNSGLSLLTISLILTSICFLLFNDFASSIVLGVALALSAVTLVQQLLHYQQKSNSTLGQSILSAIQMQVFVAILFIVLFPVWDDTATTRHGIAYFAAIIATVSGLFLASRFLIRPAFRYLAKRNSIELIPVLGLVTILSIIVIMDILNIHILIGVFLAGLLLADTEFNTEVERIVHPYKDIALGLLFLAIGLNLSLQPLFETPLLILGSIFSLVLIKTVVIAAISYYHQRHKQLSLLSATALAQSGELSFILLNIAVAEQILAQPIFESALWVIFGSMLLTPLVFWLVNNKRLPILHKKIAAQTPDIPQHPILIVGFGRFGQVVARALHAQGLHLSVIDSNQPDADFIEQYGHRFFDADVTQVENLRAAGIEYCKLLILAIDDVEDSMNLARHLRLNYPDLVLFVRARDRHHAHLLKDMGIQHIWRETYASSLSMAQLALTETGLSSEEAKAQIEQFQSHDQRLFDLRYSTGDDFDSIEAYPSVIAELEYLFENTKTLNTDRMSNEQNQQSDANSPHGTT